MLNQKSIREYMYSLMTDRRNDFIASIFKYPLLFVSLLYLAVLKITFLLRQNGILPTTYLNAKVISVGNITFGGTGKTPLVEFVSRILLDSNKKVAILTRGYKIASKDISRSGNKNRPLFEEIGDEPALLRMKLPQIDVLVGPDRVNNGRTAVSKSGADVLILDDGFQYWPLSRDIDILAIDAKNPFGNGMLLPRGILREPIENMNRASIFVITKIDVATQEQINDIKSKIKSINPAAFIFTAVHKPESMVEFANSQKLDALAGAENNLDLGFIKGKEILTVSGIGDNEYFLNTLKSLGAVIKESIFYQDHHPYSFGDLEYIANTCRQTGVRTIIVTEKDMIKIKPLIHRHLLAFESFQLQFLAVGVKLEITENLGKFKELILVK